MIRVKICGLTHADDLAAAAAAGADAVGFVFHAPSPRAVSIETARGLVAHLPPFVTSVALFVNPSVQEVEAVLQCCAMDLLQFHGDEDAGFCRAFGRPYIKALRMREGVDVQAEMAKHPDARALLLDAYSPGAAGGTGQAFDWTRIPRGGRLPIILAGGLDPLNVTEAVRATRPYAVDVSSGVEASPGRKDAMRMRAFVHAARCADETGVA